MEFYNYSIQSDKSIVQPDVAKLLANFAELQSDFAFIQPDKSELLTKFTVGFVRCEEGNWR